ncbi:tetratricopeptide repeat protein [Treponema pectinovorum]|uniref:tetratricopeptide repeat protein n=1 Tax=Treponema pectinovorum TaxID=164 RepID=UPI0011CA15C6|nr:tetratricopeptide repeat protein [Treponema pectinovorum]
MEKVKISIPHKNEIKKKYESYTPILSQIMQNVEEKLKKTIKLSSAPTYKTRVKSFNSYYRKILRLKAEEFSESKKLIALTDMMGIRIICAFIEELHEVEEQVRKNFVVKEVEYKGSGENFKEFGYESTHILISIPSDCIPQNLDLKIPDDIVCEIQVRTILQDAWAEVEHELIYKTEFSPFDMPLRRKLASINASLSLADTIFQEIRDYQKKLQSETATRREAFYKKVDETTAEFSPREKEKKVQIARVSPFLPGTIDDLLLMAIHEHNNGHTENAISIYTQILELKPEPAPPVMAVVFKHRGMAYFASNEYDHALNDFNTSVKYDPKGFRAYYYIGIVYTLKKEYEKAVEAFSKSLEINEFQSHARYRRAVAYFKLEDDNKALEDLSAAEAMGLENNDIKSLKEKILKKFDISM